MTSDGTQLSEQVSNSILETVKSIRANLKRSDDLSTSDIAYLAVDPILDDLGWNLRDPREVRRDGGDMIRLMSSGKVAATIQVLAQGKPVPEKASSKATSNEGDWVIVTNGADWNIYYAKHPRKPIRQASIESTASARSSIDALSIIEKEAMKKTDAASVWAMSINADVNQALAAHLDVSEALVSAVAAQMGSDSGATAEDIRAALSRLSFNVEQKAPEDMTFSKKSTASAKPKRGRPKASEAKKTAETARKTEKAEAAEASPAKAKAPKSRSTIKARAPADLEWPEEATHIMRRKGTAAFIYHDEDTGTSHLLAGGLLTVDIGKSLAPNLIKMREDAKFEGDLEETPEGMLKVTRSMPFNGPRLAASFAAGAQVRELSAWQTRDGKELVLADEEKSSSSKAEQASSAAKTERRKGTLGLALGGKDTEKQPEAANA